MSVVVGFIPNEYGRAALSAAVDEARRRGVRLVVVNTTKGDALVDKRYVGEEGARTLTRELEGLGVPFEIRQTVGSDIAEEIVTAAEETDADVIVLGLRRRTQVGKMLMGSVAQSVLMNAPCWVICVKP